MGHHATARSHLSLMGHFLVRRGRQPVQVCPSARRLVALVAVQGPLAREEAAGRLWTDLTRARALADLRTVLWRLHRDVPGLLVRRGEMLHLAEDVHVDLDDVRAWCRASLAADQPLDDSPAGVNQELLPGWGDPWLVGVREELRLVQLNALQKQAEYLLARGRLVEATERVMAAIALDPLRESATRLLIEIHVREGNTAEALRLYRRFESLLWRELRVAPDRQLSLALGEAVRFVVPGHQLQAGSARAR